MRTLEKAHHPISKKPPGISQEAFLLFCSVFQGLEQPNQESDQQNGKDSLGKNEQDEFRLGLCADWPGTSQDSRQRIQANVHENENRV